MQKALESREGESSAADAEALRFPLSAGKPRHDVDKKGQACMTVDCILNADVVKQVGGGRSAGSVAAVVLTAPTRHFAAVKCCSQRRRKFGEWSCLLSFLHVLRRPLHRGSSSLS